MSLQRIHPEVRQELAQFIFERFGDRMMLLTLQEWELLYKIFHAQQAVNTLAFAKENHLNV